MLAVGVFVRELLGGRTGITALVSVCKPAVFAVGRELAAVLHIGIPVTVFGKDGAEAVFHAVVHRAPDIFLVLMADLITPYVAEGEVFIHIERVGAVLPFEAAEALMHYHAGDGAASIRETGAVVAVNTDCVRVHVGMVAVLVAHEKRVLRDAVGPSAYRIAFVDR